ncbi:MAG: 50S ribosomal protein L1 [Spirochaetia bacterium]|nr:50S ribosomal protein L1 [Spirochaetia bacterium]
MAKNGKNYTKALEKLTLDKEYSLKEAVDLIKQMTSTKFDSTIEGHLNIKYKSLQNVRGIVQLPHGTGRTSRVLVFAKGEKAEEAKKAGADFVGDNDMIEKVQKGWVDYEFVVATPDLMKDVGKLGPVLGKKGLMPKPKAGTVTNDVAEIIKQLKSGRVEFKADKTGVVHMALGKLSFDTEKLVENINTAFQVVMRDKPTDAKGEYVVSMYLAGTMTPGVKINVKELRG